MAAVLVLLAVLAVPVGAVLHTTWCATGSQIDSVIQHVLSSPSPGALLADSAQTPAYAPLQVAPDARAAAQG